MNHPSAWLLNHLTGIQYHPDEPGFQRILLAPQVPRGLEWVEATVDSAYGKIKGDWRQGDGKITWVVTIPPNSSAEVRLPKSSQNVMIGGRPFSDKSRSFNLESGRYHLKWDRGD